MEIHHRRSGDAKRSSIGTMSLEKDRVVPPAPYQPPMVSAEKGPSSLRYTIGTMLTAFVVVTLVASSTYFGYAAYRLTIDFPGLNDPSPNVDGYWPAVASLINKIVAAICGMLAITIGAVWNYCSFKRRTKSLSPKGSDPLRRVS